MYQRAEPASLERIKLVKDCVSVPVIANGDVCSMDDVKVGFVAKAVGSYELLF